MTGNFYENVQNGCGQINGFNSSTTGEDLYKIVDDEPCVSAVALG